MKDIIKITFWRYAKKEYTFKTFALSFIAKVVTIQKLQNPIEREKIYLPLSLSEKTNDRWGGNSENQSHCVHLSPFRGNNPPRMIDPPWICYVRFSTRRPRMKRFAKGRRHPYGQWQMDGTMDDPSSLISNSSPSFFLSLLLSFSFRYFPDKLPLRSRYARYLLPVAAWK